MHFPSVSSITVRPLPMIMTRNASRGANSIRCYYIGAHTNSL